MLWREPASEKEDGCGHGAGPLEREPVCRWAKGPGAVRGQDSGWEPRKTLLTLCSESRGGPRREAERRDATSL